MNRITPKDGQQSSCNIKLYEQYSLIDSFCFFEKISIQFCAKQIFTFAIFVLLVIPFPANSLAAEQWIIPKIGLYGGYDDNLLYTPEDDPNKLDSYLIDVEPGLEYRYESPLTELNVTANWDFLHYLDEDDLDRVDHDYWLVGNHDLGQRWNTRADIRYIKDTTLNTYLEETGRVIDRLDRDYFDAKGGLTYAISTVSYIDTEYQYNRSTYEDDLYPVTSSHWVHLYYQHHLKTQRDVLSLGPAYYYRKNDLNDADSYSFDLGWERRWSDITKSLAAIGARYTHVEEKNGDKDGTWGARGHLSLTHQGLVSTLQLLYSHDLSTTADGENINVDNLYLNYNYLITKLFGAGIDGRIVISYDPFDREDKVDNSRYFEIQPFVFYRLTENFSMYLRYRYQHSSEDVFDSEDVRKRNSIWVEFKYEMPMIL